MNSKGESQNGSKKQEGTNGEAAGLLSGTEQTVVTYVTVPPDGGWGWVVVAASFCCNFLVDGYAYSVGVMLEPIGDAFGASESKRSWVGSLLSGFCLMSGPFVSALANRYGFRVVAILGSIVACLSFAAASLGNSIEYLCLTYGVLGGIGLGLIYVPAVITTGFYFEKWRTLATGIAVCGSGIGTCLLAPIMSYLIDTFGWRGAILLQAGMIFNCAVCGSLFRPLLPVQVTVPCDDEEDNNEEGHGDENGDTVTSNKLPLLMKIKHAREELKRADSKLSFDNEVSITAQPPRDIKRFLKAGHNMKYATVREVLNDSRETVQNLFNSPSNNSLSENKTQNVVRNKGRFDIITYKDKKFNGQVHYTNKLVPARNKLSDHEIADFPDDAMLAKHLYNDTYTRRMSAARLAAAAAILEASEHRRNSISLRYHTHRARSASETSNTGLRNRRATISSGVRPFYRDDIFYQASPNRLPQDKYPSTSEAKGMEYTMAVTRLPTFNDVLEEETSQCTLCPEAVQRTLATMLDVSLLTSPTFLLLCVSGFLTMMGFFIPFMYLPARAKKGGMDPELAAWLLSTIGITNTIGRILCGVLANLPHVNALIVTNTALTVGGIATILSGLSLSNTYQFTYAAIFGFSTSAFASLRSILIVDLIGLEKLTNGFGLLLLFQGVASAIGSPIAGQFMEMTNNHNVTFLISGSLILISGVICFPLNYINKWENERNSRQEAKDAIRDQAV